jgi:hypothetical protein
VQDLFAILIVLAAASFLAHRGWQHFAKRRRGCGACSNCPTSEFVNSSALVSISPIISRAKAHEEQAE